jgi:UrcA family protein
MNPTTPVAKLMLASLTAIGLANLCHAEAHEVTVRYRDLTITTPAGAAALYKRIRSAADRACDYLDHGDISSKAHKSACIDLAIADAVVRVGEPQLLSVYNASHKMPLPAAQFSASVARR